MFSQSKRHPNSCRKIRRLLSAGFTEALERRMLLSGNTFTVSTLADSGAGSLRQAITSADATISTDTINFAGGLTGSILLVSPLPDFTSNITLDGPGAGILTVNGQGSGSVFTISSGVTAEIENVTITGGAGSAVAGLNGLLGGGILNDQGTLTVASSTISGNSPGDGQGAGGGIFSYAGTLTVINSTISGNSAFLGGGIDSNGNATSGAGLLKVINSTISGNTVAGSGGGIDSYSPLTVIDSTISGNAAGSGGGIYAYSYPGVYANCIVDGTIVAPNPGGDFTLIDETTTGSNDLIGDGSDGGVLTKSLRGTTTTPLNPLLSPLGNFSGPTPTMALLTGSPAIGKGANFPFLDASNNDITAADQRGIARPQGTDFDIGAFQSFVANHAPSITSAGSVTFLSGFTASFAVDTIGFPTATLTETGALPNGVSFVDNGNGTATLSEAAATNTAGTFHLTITAKNGVVPNATQAFTLTVLQSHAPAITSANSATFLAGTSGTFTLTSTGTPTATLTQTLALPYDVNFVNNGDGTGTLSIGEFAPAGVLNLTFDASNGVAPDAIQFFKLTIDQAPAVESENATTFAAGIPGSFLISADGFPAPTLTESGELPSGITFVNNGNGTASLLGSAAAGTSGDFQLTLTASNGISPNDTQPFTLTVEQAQHFIITTTADSGTGSLRQAITSANAASAAIITFTPGLSGVISLASPLPSLLCSIVAVDGPGANLLTINANHLGSVFVIGEEVNAQIENLTITGGSATTGGGIDTSFGSDLTVTDSTISGNSAEYGGGILNDTGTLTVTDCTISGNSASLDSGGLEVGGGSVNLINSTVSGNKSHYGGGIRNNAGTLTVTDSTITGNSSAEGGGVYVYGAYPACRFDGSIFAANQGGDLFFQEGSNVTGSNDLIGDGSDNGVLTNSLRGTASKPLIPMLSPLGNFSGPTPTMAPLSGSPVIGTGSNFPVLDDNGNDITAADQRGLARPKGSGIDIGADQGALFLGDANFDGTVNLTDLLTLLNNYGQTGKNWTQGDFNFDGTVNLTDLLSLLNNYGQSASDNSIATPAAAIVSYRAKSTPFASAPLMLNSAGVLPVSTINFSDADSQILNPDAGLF